MATGQESYGGLAAPPDLRGAGDLEWAAMSGVPPTHPLVGGPDYSPTGGPDPDFSRSRVVTTAAQAAPAASQQSHWSELFNWQHSPLPWLLLILLAVWGLIGLRVAGHVGPARAGFSVGK